MHVGDTAPSAIYTDIPVGERRDDQTAIVAEVLVPVQLDGVDHLASDGLGLTGERRLAFIIPVVPELRQPIELANI